MLHRPVAILPWPAAPQHLKAASNQGGGLLVIGITTPDSAIRKAARELVRTALPEVLGTLLNRAPETVQLVSQPGQPLRLAPPDQHIGLSVSHEPGLSIAAIHLHGAVGVDLMRIHHEPGWLPDWKGVADTYLGQQARRRIARKPAAQRTNAFAQEWTRLEAGLKCFALPLSESNPALESRLERCHTSELQLPEGLVGTVAILPS